MSLTEFGNIRTVKRRLSGIVAQSALDDIEREIEKNVQQLYSLALSQFRFATKQPPIQWRQKISRMYYAAYNASKATRLYISGEFSKESSDHKKVGALPGDFPNTSTFSNKLNVLRTDRNLADYDHTSRVRNLTNTVTDYQTLVYDFLLQVRAYLSSKGLQMKGKP